MKADTIALGIFGLAIFSFAIATLGQELAR
jgi:hypothetical protein